ncbi:hypothetical protein OIE66_04390 [Nonomuraea sp. NBC_01738]|uniref:hypothetical protein n=1 Tax=Nonomuraea sp. NBC_01738 TaxID=2976003 RepID=UPI002E0E1F8C|nr:hypothetical protein OIE66_04390 [Nonomuraea sp. NBC_01738]
MTDARAIAEKVRGCPGVAGLSGGLFGTVATYLPGERLVGVAVHEEDVEIAIIARLGRPLPALADEIRQAVSGLTGDRLVNVRIDDLEEIP